MDEFWYLRAVGIPFFRALVIVMRLGWFRRRRTARPRPDAERILAAHRILLEPLLKPDTEGCLVFLGTLSLILLAMIIAGLR